MPPRKRRAIHKDDGAVAEVFTAKMNRQRSFADRCADWMTDSFGTVWFFNANAIGFIAWIVINLDLIPGIPAFDPYPFGFLTMVVSLEAIFLSIIVLISQNRAAKIADIRNEVDFQVNVQAEREITKMLVMLEDIQAHLNIAKQRDKELVRMKEHLNLDELEERIRKTISA